MGHNYKNSQVLKQTLDDYHTYNFKKTSNQAENLNQKISDSKSPFKYSTELTSRNTAFNNKKIFNTNSGNLPTEKKIGKFKVPSSTDVKKLINPSQSSAMNTISSSSNPLHTATKFKNSSSGITSTNTVKGTKGVNLYGSSTNVTSKKYLSFVKK
jgi:hypothetical protein